MLVSLTDLSQISVKIIQILSALTVFATIMAHSQGQL